MVRRFEPLPDKGVYAGLKIEMKKAGKQAQKSMLKFPYMVSIGAEKSILDPPNDRRKFSSSKKGRENGEYGTNTPSNAWRPAQKDKN